MTDITIIRHHHHGKPDGNPIPVRVDRWTLAKTRWRGEADDGKSFGFDLEHPLTHGDLIADNYIIQQTPEPVLVIPRAPEMDIATLAWSIGNLHQALQVTPRELITADDPALRPLLDGMNLYYRCEQRIFNPLRGQHHHH